MESKKVFGSDTYNCATCKGYNNARDNHNYVLNGFKKCVYINNRDMSKVSESRVMINKLIYNLESKWIYNNYVEVKCQCFDEFCENNEYMYGKWGRWRELSSHSHKGGYHNISLPLDGEDLNSITMGEQVLKDSLALYNHTLFTPFLCINISPDWTRFNNNLEKHGYDIPNKAHMLGQLLSRLNQDFAECGKRFAHFNYAVECGKTGEHVHSHAVARINPDMLKTVITQKNKGNLTRSIRTIWQGGIMRWYDSSKYPLTSTIIEALNDCLNSKFSIQINIIREKNFLQDKLDYLVEDLKPLDHQNKPKEGFPITGDLELNRQH